MESTALLQKEYFFVVLQGVTAVDHKFITVKVREAGRIYAASTLFQLLEDNEFSVLDAQYLPISLIKVPNVLTGSKAYLLQMYLIILYPQNNLTPAKSAINYRLSRAKRRVECAF
jgi:hypothetical protein